MDTPITRAEHEEFRRRIEDEHKRQDARIGQLEVELNKVTDLNISIEKLATNMESMLREQMTQGDRLKKLENRDGKMWRSVVSYAVTAVIGVLLGFVFKQIGL